MRIPFKSALCIRSIPECIFGLAGLLLSVRHRHCQRRNNHKGPHRSWSREWDDGDKESKERKR
jgi:hypothetical protein